MVFWITSTRSMLLPVLRPKSLQYLLARLVSGSAPAQSSVETMLGSPGTMELSITMPSERDQSIQYDIPSSSELSFRLAEYAGDWRPRFWLKTASENVC
ncbi:hypothetical protein GGH16_002427 [Coemansia sp. RSA 560]|nr:hypothetical protein GGH16_002427 [Coemansia sp. RSA 560]